MAQWHYVADNTKLGPCETAEIQTLIASGQLGASTPVWKKGLSTWIRLDTTELSQYLTGPPTISSLRPVTAGNPQVDVNLGGLERGVRVDSNVDVTLGVRSNSLAYIALGLTIVGFFTILGFLPGLICGILALQQYKKDPSIGGNGAALAAVIISGLFIALGILFGLGFVFLMILAAAVA